MAALVVAADRVEEPPRRRGDPLIVHLARNPRVRVGGVVLFALALVALLAPVIAPYDPDAQSLIDRLQGPTPGHLWGTDGLGRDMLSRAMWGARVSLAVGVSATSITIVVGVLIGLIAGYAGGWLDNVLMRAADVFIAIPAFLLLITVLTIYGSNLALLLVFLGLIAWPGTARLVRSEILSLRSRDFVTAALVVGASGPRIVLRHLLPNVVPVIVVAATLRVATLILLEASLSFFGLGVQPPTATWGNMVSDGRGLLDSAWWITTLPGSLIVVTVLAINLIGDGLRDALDPRRRTTAD